MRVLVLAILAAWATPAPGHWEEPWERPEAPSPAEMGSRLSWPGGPLGALGQDLLWAYQGLLSGRGASVCPFAPSCSRYADLALHEHGFLLGTLLSADRLLRCHREPDALGLHPRLSAGVEGSILNPPGADAWWRQ